MAFDGITLNAVVDELNKKIYHAHIDKIYQPKKDTLVFHFRKGCSELKLLASANSQNCRLHLTKGKMESPASPPMFCMLLRKHLLGGKIISIAQEQLERIVYIKIKNLNEFMQEVEFDLIIEMMGKHSNIILVRDLMIIDSLKRINTNISRFREVLPGYYYTKPPLGEKIDLRYVDNNYIMSTMSFNENCKTPISKWLLENFMGFGGETAQEVCNRAKIDYKKPAKDINEIEKQNLCNILIQLKNDIKTRNYAPTIYFDKDNDEPTGFWVFPLSSKNLGVGEKKSKISETIDEYFNTKEYLEIFKSRKASLYSLVSKNLKKLNRTLSHLEYDFEKTSNWQKHKLWGELILSNLYKIKPGLSEVELENYYDDYRKITIPLNSKLTPAENAERHFQRYKKLQTKAIKVEKNIKKTLDEINYLDNILVSINNSESIGDLCEINSELIQQGYIKSKHTKVKTQRTAPLRFKSSDGFSIYAGKNNRQNDLLTMKKSHPEDIWLHAKNVPGSHVIIKRNNQELSEKTLLEAASIAAYFSKSRNSSNVPVDYTFIKFVKKPSGARPGFVIYTNQKTLYVTPNKKIIKKLSF